MNHSKIFSIPSLFKCSVTSLAIAFSVFAAEKKEVEVLHWWTSGSEAKSVQKLQEMLKKDGVVWKDFAVAGGGGENAMTVLKTRVVAGNAPAAAQIKGPAIQEWAEMGVAANLDSVAKKENWEKLINPKILSHMKYDGHYVAVPVNVHRVNWLWINKPMFKKAGIVDAKGKVAPPKTWDEFEAAAEKLKGFAKKNKLKDFTPVAHGGQPWQDGTVFESIVLAVGGAQLYKDAFIHQKKAALTGPKMEEVFKKFRAYQKYTDRSNSGRDWNLATAMVINNKAGMQFMGDWAKGEFLNAKKEHGKDYLCVAAPGTQNFFTYNIDSFVMFKGKSPNASAAQVDMAEAILSPEFQTTFNVNKGSVPVRKDIAQSKFDPCGIKSMQAIEATEKKGGFLPSMAHNMSSSPSVQGAVFDVVTQFFNSKQAPKDATAKLYRTVMASK